MEKPSGFNKKATSGYDMKLLPEVTPKPGYCSPTLKPKKGRVLMGGIGDSYMSFYKIENEKDPKTTRASTDQNPIGKSIIAEKSEAFENLQETIMK
jgi:hypothetical protein